MWNKQENADKHSKDSRNAWKSGARKSCEAMEFKFTLCRKKEYNEAEPENKSDIRDITAHSVIKGLGGGSQRAASRDSEFECKDR